MALFVKGGPHSGTDTRSAVGVSVLGGRVGSHDGTGVGAGVGAADDGTAVIDNGAPPQRM